MTPRYNVSDKVVLRPELASVVSTVPKLVPGRVYCVEKVNHTYGNWWVRLVGVREHRIKCCDARGISTFCLKRVGRPGISAQGKEAA